MKLLRLLALATCLAAGLTAFGTAHACDAHKSKNTSASAASASECGATKATMANASMPDCCASKSAKAHKSHKTSATVAAAGKDCCMSKGATAAAGIAAGGCVMGADHAMAMDCASCEDWAMCESHIGTIGAKAQVVALKNGVMIVYTAETPEGVRAVQAAIARRGEGMKQSLESRKADAKLCGTCKQMRGALASGKLHREVVNVEKGAMDLLTSNDKSIVQMIHSMTGAQIAAR